MKQGNLRGFGAGYLSGATPPADMPDEVVTLCRSEADAILHSINYAKARFGYTQLDIAKLCGWKTDNHLSAYKRGKAQLTDDDQRWHRFAQVTGCNLLAQYQARHALTRRGHETANELARAVLAQMLRAA